MNGLNAIPNHMIEELYQRYVPKSHEYLNRDMNSIEKSGIMQHYDPRGKDAPRVFIVMDFKEWIIKHKIHSKNALFTCANDCEVPFLPHEQKTIIEYDGTPKYDLHLLNLEKKNYDFVLFNQTLEHLYNPYAAVKNIYDHMSLGGYVFTSVPTYNIPHMTPIHFSHFFPSGLICLFKQCGFEICEVGYWGNIHYSRHLLEHNSWPDIYSLPSLTNDPVRTAQCWILARKPL
jgi:hypothetical protein